MNNMIINSLDEPVSLPDMALVQQEFSAPVLTDITGSISSTLKESGILRNISAGQKIAITAGSRGITGISEILRVIIEEVKNQMADPFILPAMGSHGGNTVEGQREILDSYDITEENLGVPIHYSVASEKIDTLHDGIPVYCEPIAVEIDGIIIVNRIKSHPDFTLDHESGLMKMATIGLGREPGAKYVHSRGIAGIKENMLEIARFLLKKLPVIGGVGIVENAYHQTALVEAIPVERIPEREKELLVYAKSLEARLMIDKIDLLIVDEMGKNICGTGLDCGVIGRLLISGEPEPELPQINRIVVLDLTDESHGNCVGIGLSDVITKRLYDKIDFKTYYTNIITSSFIDRGKIPIIAATDEIAIKIGLRCCWQPVYKNARVVRIKNTAALKTIAISESLWQEYRNNNSLTFLSNPQPVEFDSKGTLVQTLG